MIQLQDIEQAMTVKLDDFLPEKTIFQEGIRRAPDRVSIPSIACPSFPNTMRLRDFPNV